MALRRIGASALAAVALALGLATAASATASGAGTGAQHNAVSPSAHSRTAGTAVSDPATVRPNGSSDNNDATVSGVHGVPAAGNYGADCPYLNFCLYTGTFWTGTRFDLYNCGTYALSHWNGDGSVINNQTPGQWAWLLYRDQTVYYRQEPQNGHAVVDFVPAWYAKPC